MITVSEINNNRALRLVHGNGLHLGELVLVLILLGVAGVELLPPHALYGPHSLRWVRLPALVVGAAPI